MNQRTQIADAMPAKGWNVALPTLVFTLLGIIFLYRETAMSMVEIWTRSETFAHAFLVPPITLWLVWRIRNSLALLTPRPNVWAILALAGIGFVWLTGELATVGVLTQFALTTMLILAVPALLGFKVTTRIAFPLAFLYFAVPFGEFAMPQLMEWTANFTVLGLRMSGIPVYREGLQFIIPTGSWSVVEACSGVRYLIASLTIGTLFAYLNYHSLRRRLIFVGVSFIVPVIANWLRAYMIVMLGHLSGNKLATGVDHLIYGWLFFGVVIFLMFFIGSRWAEQSQPPENTMDFAVGADKTITSIKYWLTALLIFVVLLIPPLAEWTIQRNAVTALPILPDMTQLEDGWRISGVELSPAWKPSFANSSAERNTIYVARGQMVGLYLGYYRQQNHERKLVSSENVLVKSNDLVWARVSSGRETIPFAGQTVTAHSAELRASNAQTDLQRLTVRQIYWINGYLTSNDFLAKFFTAVMQLTGQGDDSAVIILYAPNERGGDGGHAISTFIEANSVRIKQMLAEVRANR